MREKWSKMMSKSLYIGVHVVGRGIDQPRSQHHAVANRRQCADGLRVRGLRLGGTVDQVDEDRALDTTASTGLCGMDSSGRGGRTKG